MGCPFCKARDEPCVDNYQKAPLTEIDIFDMAKEACNVATIIHPRIEKKTREELLDHRSREWSRVFA